MSSSSSCLSCGLLNTESSLNRDTLTHLCAAQTKQITSCWFSNLQCKDILYLQICKVVMLCVYFCSTADFHCLLYVFKFESDVLSFNQAVTLNFLHFVLIIHCPVCNISNSFRQYTQHIMNIINLSQNMS